MKTDRIYTLHDGTKVTGADISRAFYAGEAVLVHENGVCGTLTGLILDGEHFDTRGQHASVGDEAWTAYPENLQACMEAAK